MVEDNSKVSKPSRLKYFECFHLFIAFLVPVAIAVYTFVQNHNDQSIALANREKDLQIARDQRTQDLQIADDQQKGNILAAYESFLVEHLNTYGMTLNGSASARYVARLKTLTAVSQLDPIRKTFLLQALLEANLIVQHIETKEPKKSGIIGLERADLSYISLENRRCKYLSLPESNLTGANFKYADLSCSNLFSAILHFADFTHSMVRIMKGMCFPQAPGHPRTIFQNADLYNARFTDGSFLATDFSGAFFDHTHMQSFLCSSCRFFGSIIYRADLTSIHLSDDSDFHSAKFLEVTLNLALVKQSTFTNAIFNHTQAKEAKFVLCSFTGTTFVNCLFNQAQFIQSNFSRLSFNEMDFSGSIFVDVMFTHLTMFGSNFTSVTFTNSTFLYVDFNDSLLFNSVFFNCTFQNSSVPNQQMASFYASNMI